jgi:HK97 family phage major capsid protein
VSNTLDIVQANLAARKDLAAELRDIATKATEENRPYTDDETGKIDEVRAKLDAVDERVAAGVELEARSKEIDRGIGDLLGVMVDQQSGDLVDTRSIGERFATPEFRAWAEGGARGESPILDIDQDFRSVVDVGSGATSGGALTRPDRQSRIGKDFIDRKVWLIDLLPHVPTNQNSVEYVQDQSPLADLADKAVEVTEGSAKPQAGPTFAVINEPTATIAAWVNVTRQTAADVPQIMGYLDGRLRYSLKRRADGQAINGNGTPPNLKGLANRSGIGTYAPSSTEARVLSIRHGITLAEQAEVVPEIIVLNPADAELFDIYNAASAGIHAQPDDQPLATQRTAWGLTQVRSNAIASGTALLIDPMAVAVIDRMQATALMTDSHASNFTSNILTLLLESRLGLALYDPKGVTKITFHD